MGAPPPPPHGESPRSSGLPPGKYDIFVIPEHSAGSGFLYLPSLQPNVNSFAAGFASALILVALFQSMAPAFRACWDNFQGLGNMGVTLLILGVGFGAWSLGRTQTDGPSTQGTASTGGPGTGGPGTGTSSTTGGSPPQPPPHGNSTPGAGPSPQGGQETPRSSWQQRAAPPQPGTTRGDAPKGSWEKAREETRRREEERRANEAEQKRREEAAKRLAELRAKEAKERREREKEKEQREKEAKEQQDAADLAERLERENKERGQKEAAGSKANGSSYAFSSVGEKTSMWPNGKPPIPPHSTGSPHGSPKKPPAPTAKTYLGTDDGRYSYRPYDQPRTPKHKRSASSVAASESSWAASQTTAQTSPPASARGRYSTKDPDKIVIKAVYLFMNQFAKTPASQLISGMGHVTDGLILRITTEGLFIDDDVRGVPQREWDVKAWTLKLVEVWCPSECLPDSSTCSASPRSGAKSSPNVFHKAAASRARRTDRGATKPLTGDEADAYLAEMLQMCKKCCHPGLAGQTSNNADVPFSSHGQTGEWKAKGLHVLRATIRDQEAKRFLFIIGEAESWKVGVGLQRLRRGAQVRQLGVSSMAASEARGVVETLGWG